MTHSEAQEMVARYHRALHAMRTYSTVDSLGPDMVFDKTAGAKEAQDAEDAIVAALTASQAPDPRIKELEETVDRLNTEIGVQRGVFKATSAGAGGRQMTAIVFGEWLKAARRKANLGLRQFSFQAGFSPTDVSQVENGLSRPSRKFVLACADTVAALACEAEHAAGIIPDEIADALVNDLGLMLEVREYVRQHHLRQRDLKAAAKVSAP